MGHVTSEQGTNLAAKTIFEPRTYPYGRTDSRIIADLLPLRDLPKSLYPMRGGRFRPPTYWYGWVLLEDDLKRLHEVASKRKLQRYRMVSELPDDPDDVDSDYIVTPKLDDRMTMEALGKAILKDLGLKLRVKTRAGHVLAPGWECRLAVFVFDNFHMKTAPSDEDVERLRVAWGFAEAPMWYPCSHDRDWKNHRGVRYD